MITSIAALALVASINSSTTPPRAPISYLPAQIVTIDKQSLVAEISAIQLENKKISQISLNLKNETHTAGKAISSDLAQMDSQNNQESVSMLQNKAEQSDED